MVGNSEEGGLTRCGSDRQADGSRLLRLSNRKRCTGAGGGTEVSKVDDALAAVDDFVAGKL